MASPRTPFFLEANGVRFAYLEEGQGPLVLLVHGFPDTAHGWDAVRPAIAAAGYRVVSPFTRGYAPSAIPADGAYDTETLGRDVLALIDAFGENRAIVVGHDWGASAAYAAATLAPDRVSLLVTVAIPHPASLRPSLRMLWTVRHFFSLRRANAARWIRAGDLAHLDELVERWSPTWKVPPEETAAVKASLSPPGHLEAALGYYRALRLKPPPALRGRIRVPTVSFAGTDDLIAPQIYDRAAPWYTGGYEVVRMPGSHFMHRQHPERFTRELLAVLERARAK